MTKITFDFSPPSTPVQAATNISYKTPIPVVKDTIRSQAGSGLNLCQPITDFLKWVWKTILSCFKRPVQPTTEVVTPPVARNSVGFYQGRAANNNGVTLDDVLGWHDTQLESQHDYIQWLFPLETPSGPNPTAPVLDQATIEIFRSDEHLKRQVFRSFQRMLQFYGLRFPGAALSGQIVRASTFNARAAVWLTPRDHNYHNFLRITRIIHSLTLLGMQDDANSFLAIMQDIAAREGREVVTPATLAHWQNAARS